MARIHGVDLRYGVFHELEVVFGELNICFGVERNPLYWKHPCSDSDIIEGIIPTRPATMSGLSKKSEQCLNTARLPEAMMNLDLLRRRTVCDCFQKNNRGL